MFVERTLSEQVKCKVKYNHTSKNWMQKGTIITHTALFLFHRMIFKDHKKVPPLHIFSLFKKKGEKRKNVVKYTPRSLMLWH